MKQVIKPVYYCDFCGKRGLSKSHMANHEAHCTKNINRKCRLCDLAGTVNDIPALVAKYKPLADSQIDENTKEPSLLESQLKELDSELDGICPNCRLSVLRLCGVSDWKWDYKKAMEETMKNINDAKWEGIGVEQ